MRVINRLFLALFLFASMSVYSQDVPLSLDDLIPGGQKFAERYQHRSLQPSLLRWYGDKLTYIDNNTIYEVDGKKGKKPKELIKLSDINEKLGFEAIKSLGAVTNMYGDISSVLIRATNKETYLLNLSTGNVDGNYKLDAECQNRDFSSSNKLMAYTKGNNLFLQTKEGEEIAVTEEANKGIVNGQSVHQREFGITKGTFWSPKGNYLAFYRMDESMVGEYPIVNMQARKAELMPVRYPMAGMKSHHVILGVYDIQNQTTTFLKMGLPEEKFLTNISWSPDEKSIYIAELNRGQDTCVVKNYDISTGDLQKTLFTETHKKYVEPQNPLLFVKGNNSQFVWMSRKDGFNHAYLYNVEGEEIKQLTKGDWEVSNILGFDEKGENLLYVGNEEDPLEQHIYKVSLKNGKRSKLTKEEGVHNRAVLSDDGKYLYDRYTSQKNPGKVAYTEVKNGKSFVFHEAKDPYEGIKMPEVTLGKIKANDGQTDLYYRMIKPLNFDPSKKYPVMVYVYGGPHSQLVDNSWMGQAGGWHLYMAELGYIVFTLDNRGTANRGMEFESITHRQLGVIETQDQMSGINYLKGFPYVDQDKIGVHGWSFGGFMTMNLMLRHPETFKVGVAGGPVTDWKYYEIMYGERYMDTPQENPEGYKETSMVKRAGDLQGRLMLIHGDIDPVVVMQHSMQFLKSAITNGTHPDLFIYPGHEHNMIGKDRVHLHEHITRYFKDFLK